MRKEKEHKIQQKRARIHASPFNTSRGHSQSGEPSPLTSFKQQQSYLLKQFLNSFAADFLMSGSPVSRRGASSVLIPLISSATTATTAAKPAIHSTRRPWLRLPLCQPAS
jgi:hypothetical protein